MIDIEKFICSLIHKSSGFCVIKVIDIVNALHNQGLEYQDGKIIRIYPELKESEDEKIRKIISDILLIDSDEIREILDTNNVLMQDIDVWLEKQGKHANFLNKIQVGDKVTRNKDGVLVNLSQLNKLAKPTNEEQKDILEDAILDGNEDGLIAETIRYKKEKQGEQKLADKVEPKFKVGDWVIYKNDICQIVKREEGCNKLVTNFGIVKELVNERNLSTAKLWTIQDAKDGDVLATKDAVFIFKHMDKTGLSLCKSYCEVIGNSELGLGFDFSIKGVYPATKEQRDTLFAKMKEAGYEWDEENKQLKKIEQKSAVITDKLKEEYQKGWDAAMQQLPKEVDSQIWQIANNSAKTWEESFAILNATQKAYDKGKKEALKERNFTWSEGDEMMISNIGAYLNCYGNYIVESNEEKAEDVYKSADWLKSLKDRYTWRPSGAQIASLTIACDRNDRIGFDLTQLLKDLKKLK